MPPVLDERLLAAAQLCLPGRAVADIGCDHGKLAVYLACTGLYPQVIGADLRPGPLEKARQTVARYRCEAAVQLRLGDGLAVLRPGEVGTVVIAGVSAQTTIEILEAAPWVTASDGPRLVLVPATKHELLRRWLAAHGYALACDRPVYTAAHWYAVMAADFTGEARQLTLAQAVYGDTARWPQGPEYAALQRGRLQKLRRGLPEGDPLAAELDTLLLQAAEDGLPCTWQ